MKRFIVILSVALMAGCALALAEDSNSANTDAMNAGQANSQATNPSTADSDQATTTTTKKTTTAKADKTCTDDNGNVLKKGEAGFRACWHEMHAKQESGIAGAAKKDNNKMDSNANPNGDNSMNNPSDSTQSSN